MIPLVDLSLIFVQLFIFNKHFLFDFFSCHERRSNQSLYFRRVGPDSHSNFGRVHSNPESSEYYFIGNFYSQYLQSPSFDPDWAKNGLQEKVIELLANWVKAQNVKNLILEVTSHKLFIKCTTFQGDTRERKNTVTLLRTSSYRRFRRKGVSTTYILIN
jgi:hypothetical protein